MSAKTSTKIPTSVPNESGHRADHQCREAEAIVGRSNPKTNSQASKNGG